MLIVHTGDGKRETIRSVASKTGTTLWKKSQRLDENCELMICDQKIVLMTESGKMLFLRSSRNDVEVVAVYELTQEPVTTHPILDLGWVFVKDRTQLHAFTWPSPN